MEFVGDGETLHTVHPVALFEALVLLVDGVGSGGVSQDVVVQIPAEVLIENRGHEVELFVIVFLHRERDPLNFSYKHINSVATVT